jgi:hypothetical protein
MTNLARLLLSLAALLGVAGTGARAQAPDFLPPMAARPALERPATVFEPVIASPAWIPPEYKLPPQTDPLVCAFQNRDPILEDPRWAPFGWVLGVETALVGTHVRNRLVDILQVGPAKFDTVRVPGASLDWTVMPRFDVGYRLPHGIGELLVSYQFLNTQGATDLFNSQGISHQSSRLAWNVFDFDYANRQQQILPELDMRWHVGLRLASMYIDNRAIQPGAALVGEAVEQRASSYMIGAGPHVAGEFSRPVNVPGLSLYVRSDLAWLFTHVHQRFEEGFAGPAPFPSGSVVDARTSQGPAYLGIQAGLHYTPPGYTLSHFFFGYQFQGWSQVGRNDNIGANADILQHGLFLRGEIDF